MARNIKENMRTIVLQKHSDKVHSVRYDARGVDIGPVRSLYLVRDALEGKGNNPAQIRVTVEVVE